MINLLPWRDALLKKQKRIFFIISIIICFLLSTCSAITYFTIQKSANELSQLKIAYLQQKNLLDFLKKHSENKINSSSEKQNKKTFYDIHRNNDGSLSLNFNDIFVRDLLKHLGEYANKNLVLSDTVVGDISIHLQHVTWKQALNAILAIKGLDFSVQDSIWFIAPIAEIHNMRQQSLSNANLNTLFIPLHYAKAEAIAMLLQNKSSDLLSERGKIAVDIRTNTLIIKDSAEKITHIQQFLRTIDVPAKQVEIAARIISVDSNFAQELGLKFGTIQEDNASNTSQNTLANSDNGHIVVTLARLSNNAALDIALAALEQQGHAQMLSKPRLITTNHETASIESGEEIPYQEKTSSGATNVDFKKAVLRLKVTPEITPENRVLLNLTVNQDSISSLTVNSVPAINTQELETQVLANNNQTIVLGGIYEQTNTHTAEKVPFLSKMPLLGNIFKNNAIHNEHKELLIFVTPRIVSD